MKLSLHKFKSKDRLLLPGLLYEPDKKTKRASVFLHGNGGSSVFYSAERMNAMGRAMAEKKIAFFAFNNRGAHYVKPLKKITRKKTERKKAGMAYELIKDCVYDIDGAIAYLKKLGYEELFLIGHSTGANKICVYDYKKKNSPFKKYVLLAPGDDAGVYYRELGKRKFISLLKKSTAEIKRGRGDKLVAIKKGQPALLSHRSLVDMLNPNGDYNTFPFYENEGRVRLSTRKPLFREYKNIKKPVFALVPQNDEFLYGKGKEAVEALKQHAKNNKDTDIRLIKDADHGFTGQDKKIAELVARWLAE